MLHCSHNLMESQRNVTYKLKHLSDSPHRKSLEWFYSSLCFSINYILIQMTMGRKLSQFYGKYYWFRNTCVRVRYLYFINLKNKKVLSICFVIHQCLQGLIK